MSMETLRADLTANLAEVAKLSALSSQAEIIAHLKDVLWPTLEALVEEMSEQDACMQGIVQNTEDILQADTGAVLAAVVSGAVAVSAALKARITREAEPQLYKVIDELEENCKEASDILDEIVLEDLDDEDDDEEDGEDDDEIDDEDEDGDEGDK